MSRTPGYRGARLVGSSTHYLGRYPYLWTNRLVLGHGQDASAMMPRCEKIGKIAGIEILVVRDKNSALKRSEPERFQIGHAVQSGRAGALEVDGRFAAKAAGTDGAAEIVVGLEPGRHLVRVTGMEVFACGIQAFAQTLGRRLGGLPRRLEHWRSRYASTTRWFSR